MIPIEIIRYLMAQRLPFTRHWHPRAVSAQRLARSVHMTGYRVAKSVIIEANRCRYIAVIAAPEELDLQRAAEVLQAPEVRLVPESEFPKLFYGCELGAEPPFGGLYGLPVIADEALATDATLVFRAGSHEETVELLWKDFVKVERPMIARIARKAEPRLPTQRVDEGITAAP